jgi:hypothetical protein
MEKFKVFHRTWWKESKGWPNGLEPQAGTRHHIATVYEEDTARELCEEWNNNNEAGRLSDKAEFERV